MNKLPKLHYEICQRWNNPDHNIKHMVMVNHNQKLEVNFNNGKKIIYTVGGDEVLRDGNLLPNYNEKSEATYLLSV